MLGGVGTINSTAAKLVFMGGKGLPYVVEGGIERESLVTVHGIAMVTRAGVISRNAIPPILGTSDEVKVTANK